MPSGDYRRFMNFLAAHDCGVAVREFRGAPPLPETLAGMPPLYPVTADSAEEVAAVAH